MAELRVSRTKYLRPLLPPGACFHSQVNSKLSNSLSDITSPPALPRQCSQPSSTSQPFCGKVFFLKLCQPAVVLPSKSKVQPLTFSSSVSVLTIAAEATTVAVRVNVNIQRVLVRVAIRMVNI